MTKSDKAREFAQMVITRTDKMLKALWKKLTPSQRVTLLYETKTEVSAIKEEYKADLYEKGTYSVANTSGAARHALGRKGLLDIEGTVSAPTTYAGFHTIRKPTELGYVLIEFVTGKKKSNSVHLLKRELSR